MIYQSIGLGLVVSLVFSEILGLAALEGQGQDQLFQLGVELRRQKMDRANLRRPGTDSTDVGTVTITVSGTNNAPTTVADPAIRADKLDARISGFAGHHDTIGVFVRDVIVLDRIK